MGRLDAKALQTLASGFWPYLTGLGISGCFTLNHFVVVAASALCLLDSVYLDCDYSPPHAISFAGAWRNMRHLNIKTRHPTSTYFTILPHPVKLGLGGADWRKLQSLDLSYSHLGGQGFSQLALGDWPQLSRLDVGHLELTKDEFVPEEYADFATGKWPQLTYLCLSDTGVDDDCAAELVVADWPKLQVLDLSYNHIDATGSAALAGGNWPNMEHLCLYGNELECTCQCCESQAGF